MLYFVSLFLPYIHLQSKMANTDASSSKVESKRKREVSEKEREQTEAKRQVREGCLFLSLRPEGHQSIDTG